MLAVRNLLACRRFAVLLCVSTLLLKMLVPGGYMLASDHGRLTITFCTGVAPRSATMAMPGMHGSMPDHGKPKEHGRSEMPCAFSSLATAAMGAIDPIQLAALIAFVLAIGLTEAAPPRATGRTHLRPPPRGPPIYL